jgi:hypothetical protein
VDDQYEWFWLSAAVEPATGRCVCCYLPGVTKEWFARFLVEVAKEVGP